MSVPKNPGVVLPVEEPVLSVTISDGPPVSEPIVIPVEGDIQEIIISDQMPGIKTEDTI